jgi:hypothetical protein
MSENAFTDSQRDEINELIGFKLENVALSKSQKWDASVIFAAMLGGSLAIFGAAGYFAIDNAATKAATTAATNLKVKEVTESVIKDQIFRDMIKEATTNESRLVPVGTIAAFNLSTGCPQGWMKFDEGVGRVLIGVGAGRELTARNLGSTGGSERVILNVDQLPPHSHDFVGGPAMVPGMFRPMQVDERPAPWNYVAGTSTGTIALTGRGQQIDIMPPFVALHMCRKE